jgi:hypothetical protein
VALDYGLLIMEEVMMIGLIQFQQMLMGMFL